MEADAGGLGMSPIVPHLYTCTGLGLEQTKSLTISLGRK
jgi:hypothetical protein